MKNDLINGRTPEHIKRILAWRSVNCAELECDKCPNEDICSPANGNEEAMARDALALIERLEAERDAALAKVPKWISVEEQSEPKEDGEYWCHGYWIGSGRKQTETAEYLGEWKISNAFVLTHWMPLPEPPKEGE